MGVVIDEVQGVVEPDRREGAEARPRDRSNENIPKKNRSILAVINRREWLAGRVEAD